MLAWVRDEDCQSGIGYCRALWILLMGLVVGVEAGVSTACFDRAWCGSGPLEGNSGPMQRLAGSFAWVWLHRICGLVGGWRASVRSMSVIPGACVRHNALRALLACCSPSVWGR